MDRPRMVPAGMSTPVRANIDLSQHMDELPPPLRTGLIDANNRFIDAKLAINATMGKGNQPTSNTDFLELSRRRRQAVQDYTNLEAQAKEYLIRHKLV